MYLCPKDTTFLHVLMKFCYFVLNEPLRQSLILFEWIPESFETWKKIENQTYPLRPVVNFGRFQCVMWERSKTCVHIKQQIYCQNRFIMSQKHSSENNSWPLDDLELWPFDSLDYASKLVKMLQISTFSKKIHTNGTTLAFSVDGLDFRW